ncbi:hypothetical protein FXF61_13795 [Pseudomonas sp. C27(2019)]|uniref:hypothetical protein n=1 Tax=Pseudomonas sp. C27(2019) TaxID=2604941 RepID=UPI001244A434|nr:hypothetical protein [Pseudomonas sp. C27(2019)]QEY60150.1 hypothetical protein FXF61_13795 [Pseudomonas sp. C27(2019)]
MRFLLLFCMLASSSSAFADIYLDLYKKSGWPQQQEHFSSALQQAQQRYQDTLPSAIYQTLVNNSNSRFAADAMHARGQKALRQHLANPAPALAFFSSSIGQKVSNAETAATHPAQLKRYTDGMPAIQADATRRLLIRHLANALPASQAGAEVTLALGSVAADSLSQMLPGVIGAEQTNALLETQRQRLLTEIDGNIDNTLLHVYQDLSDAELEEFVNFAQSAEGQSYYQAAFKTLQASLRPAQ